MNMFQFLVTELFIKQFMLAPYKRGTQTWSSVRLQMLYPLTDWGRVMHICVSNLNIIGSDNGLSPGRHQAIIWINAGIWWIGPLETNFSEIFIQIHTFSFKEMHLKLSSAKLQSFCLGLNVLMVLGTDLSYMYLHIETKDSILSFIFMIENCISIQIAPKFVP